MSLKDSNIIGDEEGNALYGVDVTVTEAQWTVVDMTASGWSKTVAEVKFLCEY